ncbi:MAG TPA: GH25 family lysozyme [Actinophytocola sp.]|uniref:GH25 family lysozyme n=1 Tax=Actinophytocola sp. TaxID=1872138 RepID=UPI002DBBF59E|nr:GH25 family lysozyme [Actinophytocola sp.]HEU5473254.1 GH25 family lysozyme [Actinophytocola sp.]
MTATLARLAGGLLGAAVLLAGLPPLAPAAQPAPPANPERDFMGSTLATHEPQAVTHAVDAAPYGTPGIDVSHWQGRMDWPAMAARGIRWAYMKATQGTSYRDPEFGNNYTGSRTAGLLRGAYHFAQPSISGGAAQAHFFVDNGGGWSADGWTLPPVLDIEYNPYGPTCYGLTPGQMVAWVDEFATTVRARTGRWPVVYTTRNWWRLCTGNSEALGLRTPLWIAGFNGNPVNLPYGWTTHTMWQYAVTDMDQDVFNGTPAELRALAVDSAGDAIAAHYDRVGGAAWLGLATGARYAVGAGSAQNYTGGRIYFTPGGGAWSVRGDMLDRYLRGGGPAGVLGFPGSDELYTSDGSARFNHFMRGSFWAGPTGFFEVRGSVREKWGGLGWERSQLGHPTSDEQRTADGAAFSLFQGGAIYYTPGTGAHEVRGSIYQLWRAFGAEWSFFGYPVTDETRSSDGVGSFSHFQRGSIFYHPGLGVREVHGAIRDKYAALGWERSHLGYPTTNELRTPDGIGAYNLFQQGSIHWTPATGAHEVRGLIYQVWASLGLERSVIGYPITDETPSSDGVGSYNHFQRGSIFYRPGVGAQEVRGAIRDKWAALGWERSVLGYPTTNELRTPDGIGAYNLFQQGSIHWTPATGAHEVRGAIFQRWVALGSERGRLGYPTSDEYDVPGGRRTNFQRGTLTWNRTTGAVTG